MAIRTEELTSEAWPDLERLFGANGACGGCWCMWWRVPQGGKLWEATKGAPAKRALKELVTNGEALGILAYEGDEPIGWCSYGPRADFPRTERIRAYQRPNDEEVWSINCFYIPRAHRGRGLARTLLGAAIAAAERRGAKLLEAYPVTTSKDGRALAPAFSWTGPLKIFQEHGFEVVRAEPRTKPLVRRRAGA